MEQNSVVDRLTISIPRDTMTDQKLDNLKALVRNKETLIRKALDAETLDIVVDREKISFPWFRNDHADRSGIYAAFITELCNLARKLRRVNTRKDKGPVENEKYAFRCFLLRLGFVGDTYKKHRKILLKNLEGSSAFKNGNSKENREHED